VQGVWIKYWECVKGSKGVSSSHCIFYYWWWLSYENYFLGQLEDHTLKNPWLCSHSSGFLVSTFAIKILIPSWLLVFSKKYKKSVLMDFIPFQIKGLKRLKCLLRTTDLFRMLLSLRHFREITQTRVIITWREHTTCILWIVAPLYNEAKIYNSHKKNLLKFKRLYRIKKWQKL